MKEEAKRTVTALLDFLDPEVEEFEKDETEKFFKVTGNFLIIYKLQNNSLQNTIVEALKQRGLNSNNITKIEDQSLQKATDQDIQYITDTFNNLKYLIIDSASDITDLGLQHLNKLKALQNLVLNIALLAIPKITQQGILNFAYGHPNAQLNSVQCSEINKIACMKTTQEKVKVLNVFWSHNPLKEPPKIKKEVEQYTDKVEPIEGKILIIKQLENNSLKDTLIKILEQENLDPNQITVIKDQSLQKATDQDLEYIANTFNNLQYLEIDSASDTTDLGLQYLSKLKALQSLMLYTIFAVPKITQQGLLDFAYNHPNARVNSVQCSELNQIASMETHQDKVEALRGILWPYNPLKEPTIEAIAAPKDAKPKKIPIVCFPNAFFRDKEVDNTSLVKSITDKVLGIDILDYPYMAGTALVATNTLIAFCNPYLAVFAYLVVNTAVAYKLDSLPESFVNIIDNASARVMNCRNK